MVDGEITAEPISATPAAQAPRQQLRLAAVSLAVDLDEPCDCDPASPHGHRLTEILHAADRIYAWITKPPPVVRLVGRVGTPTPTEGTPVSNPQVPASYSFTITIEPRDIEGNDVSDSLTWTSSDTADAAVTADSTTLIGTVEVINPAANIVITATDGANTYTYEFDGVADAPTTLVGTVGAPFKTPPASVATA